MQIEHKTEKGTLLFLNIENDYSIAGLNDGHIYFWTSSLFQSMRDYPLCDEIPNGNFEYIGLTIEVTEGQAKMMVDEACDKWGNYWRFKDYEDFNYYHETALESFKSLMQHLKVYEVNPYGEKPTETFNHPEWEYKRTYWNKAQETVGKWIVLFKPND